MALNSSTPVGRTDANVCEIVNSLSLIFIYRAGTALADTQSYAIILHGTQLALTESVV